MPGEIFEIIELGVYALFGWRYIFSGSFRRQTHAKWKVEGWTTIVFDVSMAGVGMVFTGLLIWLLVWVAMQLGRG